jgi:hypothetical protein
MKKRIKQYDNNKYFHGNSKLRAAEYSHNYTDDELIEVYKCSNDFIYFCVNYIKIVDQDSGKLIPFDLYEYQKQLFDVYDKNNRVIVLAPRQSGKSVFTIAYLLWFSLFNEFKNIVLIANKEKTARKTLKKLKEMYTNLPFFLKQGVTEWNKLNISFENGSNIYAEATAASGNRGDTVSILYIDECAIIDSGIWEDFYSAVYPTIASVKSAKIIISSTPKGYNFFYQLWTMASNNQNDYKPFRVKWNEVPGRDEDYKIKTIAALGGGAKGLRKWRQEYECFFVGSGGSLIEGEVLEKLNPAIILEDRMDKSFLIYEYPEENSNYIIISDVAEGVGEDYSTCQIFKILNRKYKQVATYRNNEIKTNEFDLIIDQIARYYNNALSIVESNSYGREILNRLVFDDEYENVFFEADSNDYGLKMTKQSKAIGNSYLKTNVETGIFELVDFETISELSKYIKKNKTYQADSGQHDDLVTPLVLFSYFLSKRRNIEDWLNVETDIQSKVRERIQEELLPIGFIADGSENVDLQQVVNNIYDDDDYEYF